ncbi:MAG: hypothetical protein AAGN82_22375 [Myxococcota bacterium]
MAAASPKCRPLVIYNWDANQSAIPGYKLKEQPLDGLIYGGAWLAGITYGLTASVVLPVVVEQGVDDENWDLVTALIPVVGPLIRPDYTDGGAGFYTPLLLASSVVQLTGVGMILGGISFPNTVLVRSDLDAPEAPVSLSGAPVLLPGVAGASLRGAF